jgi:hypothetical protein
MNAQIAFEVGDLLIAVQDKLECSFICGGCLPLLKEMAVAAHPVAA